MLGFTATPGMRTLLGMPNAPRDRQSPEATDVDREQVEYFARQVRRAMDRLEWKTRDGKYDIERLRLATDVRWQTAQNWVTGTLKVLPELETVVRIAKAFAMTLDELIGLAHGDEPTNEAWVAFLQTPEGKSMTPDERRTIGSRSYGERTPTVLAYQLELMAFRATQAS